jgi:3-oxoadipate enol-lactonase
LAEAGLINGVELSWRDRGAGPPLLLLHETAATAAIWDRLIDSIGADARTIAPDRRGWGASGAPDQYVATAVVCGAGLGAVTALELLLRHRDRVRAAVIVEAPLLALLPEATAGVAADRQAITEAVGEGGAEAAIDLYLRGGLPHLGAGAERIPEKVAAAARDRAFSLFAELGAVPAWSLRSAEMLALEAPSRIVVGGATPAVLRKASEQLAIRLGGSEQVDVGGQGLPHVEAAGQLADVINPLL